ncbi:PIN domain-containing protein [uncultured Jatrophihabitans sp.]|uniref:PIN domain-containing protein n=1 Tax=uncultured Jatrophihabitans sp. TaxID=1610747 RepID=UPI0035CB0F5A
MTRSFVDTNVLVYSVDANEPVKRPVARRVLAEDPAALVLSTQVLGEFYVTVTRKLRVPMTAAAAAAAVTALGRLRVVATDLSLVHAAMATAQAAQLSYWDALIIEAAASAGCDRVLTEDLNAGATIRGVTIVNPFDQRA